MIIFSFIKPLIWLKIWYLNLLWKVKSTIFPVSLLRGVPVVSVFLISVYSYLRQQITIFVWKLHTSQKLIMWTYFCIILLSNQVSKKDIPTRNSWWEYQRNMPSRNRSATVWNYFSRNRSRFGSCSLSSSNSTYRLPKEYGTNNQEYYCMISEKRIWRSSQKVFLETRLLDRWILRLNCMSSCKCKYDWKLY
jgi:hypothetical protein